MVAYVADSAASAPPPRIGPPLIPPPRASTIPASGSTPGGGPRAAGGSDYDEDAAPAFDTAGSSAVAAGLPGSGDEEDGPPIDQLESRMRGEIAARESASPGGAGKPPARRSSARDDEDEAGAKSAPLPELDVLVARLPAEVRETLDELFRSRFVNVKRLPKAAFQAARTKASGSAESAD